MLARSIYQKIGFMAVYTEKEDNTVSEEINEQSSEIEGLLNFYINTQISAKYKFFSLTHKDISFCLNIKVLYNYKLCFQFIKQF